MVPFNLCVGVVLGLIVGANVLTCFRGCLMMSALDSSSSCAPLVGDLQGTLTLASKLCFIQIGVRRISYLPLTPHESPLLYSTLCVCSPNFIVVSYPPIVVGFIHSR